MMAAMLDFKFKHFDLSLLQTHARSSCRVLSLLRPYGQSVLNNPYVLVWQFAMILR